MEDYDEIDRAGTELVVLHDELSWREHHELTLRRAGFGQVVAYPASLQSLTDHLNHGLDKRVDLIVYGIQDGSESSWECLREVRGMYAGPLLATTNDYSMVVNKRIQDMGIYDYMAVGELGEVGLEIKIETALTAHRISNLILENDLRTQRLFVNILTVMVKILESKDAYTRFHSHSVAKWSRMIGRRTGLCEEDLDRLGLAAVFHDFGKIGIPEEILCKPSALTDAEYAKMKEHPTIARHLLSSLELLSDLMPAITHHHERWDGRGYPDGLKGDQTPLWARIIALADAYDTMMSRRTYKEPYSPERIRVELEKARGKQFDPDLVDHFKAILDEHGLSRSPMNG